MEKIIFILLPIIYFIYKAYENFKKEQIKAAKRAAENGQVIKQITIPVTQQTPSLNKDQNQFDSQDFLKEKFKEQQLRKREITDYNKKVKQSTNDYYNPEIPSEEVVVGRALHEPHAHQFQFPPYETNEGIDFDLKKAIIYQTILGRPNY